jgi:hypothetical protein
VSSDVGERRHESLERWRELLRLDAGELLKLEKRRRGVLEDKLLFVNAANLAEFWWCAQKSLLQAREDEPAFFTSYVLQGAEVVAPGSSVEGSDPLELLQHVERVYKTHGPDEVLSRVAEKMKRVEAEVYPAVKVGDRILTLIRRDDKLVVLEEGGECDLIEGGHSDC